MTPRDLHDERRCAHDGGCRDCERILAAFDRGRAEGVAAGLRMAAAEATGMLALSEAAHDRCEQVPAMAFHQGSIAATRVLAAWCEQAAKDAERGAK